MDSSLKAPASLRALLSDLIDYAGLFPPAGLSMQEAVSNYARYVAGPDAWALARFVLPVSRFAEFEAAVDNIRMIEPWGITALLGASPETDLAEIDKFNHRNHGRAAVDCVEVKANSSNEICHIRGYVRGSITAYFEILPAKAPELLPTIKAIHGRAKLRTGGVTADAFPSSQTVADFIAECAKHEVAFKATAGLHHPVRGVKPLTYEADAPTGTMHGFLSVFMAGGQAQHGATPDQLCAMLEHEEGKEFHFADDSARWGDQSLTTDHIRQSRHNFAISFGSCSFEEPLADLRGLHYL